MAIGDKGRGSSRGLKQRQNTHQPAGCPGYAGVSTLLPSRSRSLLLLSWKGRRPCSPSDIRWHTSWNPRY